MGIRNWLNWKPVFGNTILKIAGVAGNSAIANYTTGVIAISTSGVGMISTGGRAIFATTLPAKCCYLGASALYGTTCVCGIIDTVYCRNALCPLPILGSTLGFVTSYGAKSLQCAGDCTDFNCFTACSRIWKWWWS